MRLMLTNKLTGESRVIATAILTHNFKWVGWVGASFATEHLDEVLEGLKSDAAEHLVLEVVDDIEKLLVA